MAPATLTLIDAGEAQEGRRARDRAHRRHHGGEADARADPALPSPALDARSTVDFDAVARSGRHPRRGEVKVEAKTGVEMEALTAVSVACLTIYDMVKAVDKA